MCSDTLRCECNVPNKKDAVKVPFEDNEDGYKVYCHRCNRFAFWVNRKNAEIMGLKIVE